MKITQIDDRRDLFHISELLSAELLKKLSELPIETLPFKKQEWQEDWNLSLIHI